MPEYLTGAIITATIKDIAIPANTICYYVSNSDYAKFSDNNYKEVFVNATGATQSTQITTSNITDTSKSSVTVSISGYCQYGGKQSNTSNTSFTLKQAVNNIGISSVSTSANYGAAKYDISYTIVPTNAFNKGVTFTLKSGNAVSISGKTVTVLAAGSSTITYTSADSKVNGQFTINVNKVAATKTNPSAKTGLVYNGSAQQIINAGSTSHGVFYYNTSKSDTGATMDASAAALKSTSAGIVTRYWKFVPDSNHTGEVAWTALSCSIAKANQSAPTATGDTTYYPNVATAYASGGGGQGSLSWTNGNTLSSVGSKDTAAYWSGNANYNASSNSNTVTLTVLEENNSYYTSDSSSYCK